MRPMEMRAASVRTVFLGMAAVLAGSLIISFFVGNQALKVADQRSAHEDITRELQQTFSTLQDAETGQRGFLLAQDESYLEPYTAATDEVPAHLARLRRARDQGDIPADLSDRFERLTTEKLAELSRTISTARRDGYPAAVSILRTDEGQKKMDELRAVHSSIREHEKEVADGINRHLQRLSDLRAGVFAAAIAINLGFLAWAFRRIRREMARRSVADLEAQRQRDILAVSLASIGDAVIVTDTESRITFLNDVAVELTGWGREEALGQACGRVFRIVNETSRAVVESPVDAVLRTGKIVGLANHTILIRKDGSEVPIDDSGAPMREPDGTVRGVILVFRDFSQYKNAENEQRRLRERLEVANLAKDNFLATLSHELRTPLTPVLATLSAWESNREVPSALIEDVRMLTRNVRLEVRLIDDLLDLTRIARGQMTLRRERVDVHALLAAVVEIFRRDLDRRLVRIGVRMAAKEMLVDGDPARLQQVFWNILGNAAKFTPDGGRIEIVTTNIEDDLRVTFADNGRGMSEETIKGLFQPFERTANRAGYQPGGLGIGLTISQNLMRAQGGEIEVKSGGVGLGASFTVRIPTLKTEPETDGGSIGSPVDKPVVPALAIMLLEDHADSAQVISRILRALGHSVDVVHNVADALVQIGARRYDLVLSDIGLPDGTGIDFISKAREFCSTPMIALTGYGMEEDVARYMSAGFFRQLTKPVRFDQLEELLHDFVAAGPPAQ